jgi:branched-chain amino acid transport system permease protein
MSGDASLFRCLLDPVWYHPDLHFTLILLSSGVMIGLMYALIALGFVLIYKATDAINFAQGEFVMFAGFLAAVTMESAPAWIAGLFLAVGAPLWLSQLLTESAPFWLAALLAMLGMIALGFGLERVVLRPLVGRPVIAVVMATIGLAAVLRGSATLAFGAGTRAVVMPVSDAPLLLGDIMLSPVQLIGAAVSLVFLAAFTWFFLKSRTGIAMRAVADSQQVAMAMGINLRRYFALAWAMAGIVSALGGVVWGTMLGVDNQLALVGLKVFPVVILGGLDSVLGAVIGGLIVGAVESLAAGYFDPCVGGGTKDFAPYVLMILVLMVRPEGIFGRRRIERV